MHKSQVIEVAGHFAGAAVSQGRTYRFVAVDPRVEALDHSVWSTLPAMHRAVQCLLLTGHLPRAAA